MLLRVWLVVLAVCLTSSIAFEARADAIKVRDILGRSVTLDAPAKRIVMGAGRQLPVLGLLHPDPGSLVVGWRGDFKLDQAQYGAWIERFPSLEQLPVLGGNAAEGLPVETIVGLEPDLVILSLYDVEAEATARSMAVLEQLGIPVLVVDFFSHPLKNTLPSLKILGQAINAEDKADAFAAFYSAKLDLVRSRIASSKEAQPGVFMHVHAGGMPCCPTPGHGVFNDMIELAGARNIALAHVPGLYGDVRLEQLLVDDPQFYIATGGSHLAARGGLVLGPGVSGEQAVAGLDKLLATAGIADLTAVRENRSFALWHMFNDTPAHIAMIELLARQFHPDLFRDVDPQQTIEAINRDFLAVPMTGTYWVVK